VKTKHPLQKRRILRERVLQALYARELSQDSLEHIITQIFADLTGTGDELHFAVSLLRKTTDEQSFLDSIITKKAANWDFGRIALIDKLLLRMGICELYFFDDIPPKVSINEAIDIAKRYSTEKSGVFVNGILDAILHDMKKEGTLTKKGRGLLDSTAAKDGSSHPPEKKKQ
jgi:N utilization substance protein B